MEHNIFEKVLFLGPSRKAMGGIAAVLDIYERALPGFRQLTTNSPGGTLKGILPMLSTMVRLPIERLRGRRILHVHAAGGKSFIRKSILMAEGKLLGYKIVFHAHSGTVINFYSAFGIKRVKRILSMATKVVVLSEFWENYYRSTFGLSNVKVIHNPVEPPANIEAAEPTPPLQLLFLGLIHDPKGIFDLIEVIGANRDRWRGRVHLTIGGIGETERMFERINALGIDDFVTYLGWATGKEREDAFNRSHVLVLPSYAEGLPMSIIEAMIRNKAVIASHVGGIPEIVTPDENGFLIAPGDRRALANAIDCYLLNPALLERHGRVGAQRAEQFHPSRIAAELADFYESL